MGSGREVFKNTYLIWQISFNGQRCYLQIRNCFLNDRSIACSWYIKNRKKAVFAIVLFPIQNIPDEGHYLSRKQVGSALTETKNWDLLVDCTSRDGRKMLDAGVHLSDKCTLLLKTYRPFQTQYKQDELWANAHLWYPCSSAAGSRNLTGQKMLPTLWGTYIKFVTKYQISAINSAWEKCD